MGGYKELCEVLPHDTELEIMCTGNRTVGSNPTLSAILL